MSRATGQRPFLSRWTVPGVLVVLALALVGGNAWGRPALAVAVVVAQALLVLAWLVAFASPLESVVMVALAVAITDVVVLRSRSATGGSLAGVIGLSVIALLFNQLPRRDKRGVIPAVAVPLGAIVLAAALAMLLPLRELEAGRSLVFAGVATAAAAVVAARSLVGPDTVRRVAGLVVAVLVALACGLPKGDLSAGDTLAMALAAGASALLTDRAMQRLEVSAPVTGRSAYALAFVPVTAMLPLVLASPIVYLAGRVITPGVG